MRSVIEQAKTTDIEQEETPHVEAKPASSSMSTVEKQERAGTSLELIPLDEIDPYTEVAS